MQILKNRPDPLEGHYPIFGELSPRESAVIEAVASELAKVGPLASDVEIYLPVGVGNHVDHQLARVAAEKWLAQTSYRFHHYADYPYAQSVAGGVEVSITETAREAKIQAVRAYVSQLSSFWADDEILTESVGKWTERLFE